MKTIQAYYNKKNNYCQKKNKIIAQIKIVKFKKLNIKNKSQNIYNQINHRIKIKNKIIFMMIPNNKS